MSSSSPSSSSPSSSPSSSLVVAHVVGKGFEVLAPNVPEGALRLLVNQEEAPAAPGTSRPWPVAAARRGPGGALALLSDLPPLRSTRTCRLATQVLLRP
jgi:hypothetical protein